MKTLQLIILALATAMAGCAQTEVARVGRAYRAMVAYENEMPVLKDEREVHNVRQAQDTWSRLLAIPENALYQELLEARHLSSAQMNEIIRRHGVIADVFTSNSTLSYMFELPRRYPVKDLTTWARSVVERANSGRDPGAARVKGGFAIRPPLDVQGVEQYGSSLERSRLGLDIARRSIKYSMWSPDVRRFAKVLKANE